MEYLVLFIDRPPLSWSSLITLLMKNWEKDPTFTTYIPSTWNSELFFVIFWTDICLILGSHELIFYGHQSQSIIRSNVFYGVDVMFFFKLLRLQVKNVLLSPNNINSHGFSLQSFEIIVSLKLIEMWTVMFTKGVNNFFFENFSCQRIYI